jgi:NADH-quinone oxidoreductase subunit H
MSDFVAFILEAVVKSLIVIVGLIVGMAYTTLLERRLLAALQSRVGPNRAGPQGILQPWADALKLFFKEDIMPAEADKVIYAIAPALTIMTAWVLLAVVPLGENVRLFGRTFSLGISDVNVGVLYVMAVTSIGVYGIVLAGWSSANKWSMLGGLRSSAQMISYEIAMGLAIIGPVLLSGSMSVGDIINAQAGVIGDVFPLNILPNWYIFLQPIAGIIFIITMFAETNRAPFDLPEAEQELVAGFQVEYSGVKFALFYLAEYIKMIGVSVVAASLFFGGYRLYGLEEISPWLGPVILFVKVFFFLSLMIWVRATLPRFRYDQLMAFGWKVMLPLSLASVAVTAVAVVLVG